MILQCQGCSKVKKFGEWVEVPENLTEVLKDVRVINALCPECKDSVLSVPSLNKIKVKVVGTV